MSKKKSSQKKRVRNQKGNSRIKGYEVSRTTISFRILKFLTNQLINLFIKACFEEQIKQLKTWLINLILDIFC